MKVLLARLLLAFMLMWLPLQGYALEAMSMCQKHHDHAAMQKNTVHHDCHGDHGAPAETSSSLLKSNLGCDDCVSCYLIAQPALIMESMISGPDIVRPQQPLFTVTFTLFFPEQPQRPPLTLLS